MIKEEYLQLQVLKKRTMISGGTFHRKINKWDTCRDLLIVEKHLEKLQEHKRTPSPYQKKDDTFWIGGGKEEAARVQREKSLEGQLDKNWQELQSAVLEPAQQQPMMPSYWTARRKAEGSVPKASNKGKASTEMMDGDRVLNQNKRLL